MTETPLYDETWKHFSTLPVGTPDQIGKGIKVVVVMPRREPVKRAAAKPCPECGAKRGHKMDCSRRR